MAPWMGPESPEIGLKAVDFVDGRTGGPTDGLTLKPDFLNCYLDIVRYL